MVEYYNRSNSVIITEPTTPVIEDQVALDVSVEPVGEDANEVRDLDLHLGSNNSVHYFDYLKCESMRC